ncbi:hypothetical protein V2A60_005774 [Cordyceps javanica]
MQLDQILAWLNATEPSEPSGSGVSTAGSYHDKHNGGGQQRRPDNDETLRTRRSKVGSAASTPSSGLSYDPFASGQSPAPQRSGRPSPEKQLRRLQLHPEGLDVRELATFRGMPEELETMLDRIAAFSDGKGIVPPAVQGALAEAAASDRAFRWALRGSDHVSDEPAMTAACTPAPQDVRDALDAAVECSTQSHNEANWIMQVHAQILRMAFQPGGNPKYIHLVNPVACIDASFLASHGITKLSKEGDFCIYMNPEHAGSSSMFSSAVQRARAAFPHGILSFEELAPLYDRLVVLSMGTNLGERFEAARLQLGLWEMARWAFLRRWFMPGATPTGPVVGVTGLVDTIETSHMQQIALKFLPSFLPSIIIQGHDWWLFVATAEGKRTVLWQRVLIGSTSNSRGVYQIVSALQYLENWVRDVRWPWVRVLLEVMELYRQGKLRN